MMNAESKTKFLKEFDEQKTEFHKEESKLRKTIEEVIKEIGEFVPDEMLIPHTITDFKYSNSGSPVHRTLKKLYFEDNVLCAECTDGVITDNFSIDDIGYMADEVYGELYWKEEENEETIEDDKVYSVWVGGGEVNNHFVTKETAERIAEAYKEDGYDDVVIVKKVED